MQPTKSILDKSFRYVPAARSDIRVRFAKVRFDLAKQKLEQANAQAPLRTIK